jgi:lysophospholipase L1-like esterase
MTQATKKQRIGLKAVLALAAAGLTLSAVELGTRALYRIRHGEWPVTLAQAVATGQRQSAALFVEHPILPFVLRPGAKVDFMDTDAQINTCGFRGPELRPSPSLRILAVGGSTTFDTGVTDDAATWCRRLEHHLHSAHPGVEVINGGLPIYALWGNYIKYLLDDHRIKPDVVLIYQGFNDTLPWRPSAYAALADQDYWRFCGATAREWSALRMPKRPMLPGLVDWRGHSVLLTGAFNERGENVNAFAQMVLSTSAEEAASSELLAENRQLLDSFVATLRSQGVLPVFVPQSIGRPDRKKSTVKTYSVFVAGLSRINAAYREVCERLEVPVVDCTDVMNGWGDEYFADNVHFNDKGAAEFARLLALRLVEQQVLQATYAERSARPRSLPVRIFQHDVAVDRDERAVDALTLETIRGDGFGPIEGPFPQWDMPRPVRWMHGTQAALRIRGSGTCSDGRLQLRMLTHCPTQKLLVRMNGATVVEHAFTRPGAWETVTSAPLPLAAGWNVVEFEAADAVDDGRRQMAILFDEVTLLR